MRGITFVGFHDTFDGPLIINYLIEATESNSLLSLKLLLQFQPFRSDSAIYSQHQAKPVEIQYQAV